MAWCLIVHRDSFICTLTVAKRLLYYPVGRQAYGSADHGKKIILILIHYYVIVEGDNTSYWRGLWNNYEMQINLCCTYCIYCTWL